MTLRIELQPQRGRRQTVVTAFWRDDLLYRDSFNLDAARQRSRFAQVVAGAGSVTVSDVEAALLSACEQLQRTQQTGDSREGPDDPFRLARILLDNWRAGTSESGLVYWRDEFYGYDGICYRPISRSDALARICAGVKEEFDRLGGDGILGSGGHCLSITTKLINDVLLALKCLGKLDDSTRPPAWLHEHPQNMCDDDTLIASPGGIVDIDAWTRGAFRVIPSTPEFFTTRGIDYACDPNATCPRWQHFLFQTFGDDTESIQLLQEWFGYCLTTDTSQQKFLMICGPSRSGKGTIGRVLRSLIGTANVAGITLRGLQNEFGLQPLIEKPVAIIPDARLSGKTDVMALLEVILSITGEDAVQVNRKNLPILSLTLPTRIVLITNEFPRFQDASQALFSRLLLLQLRTSRIGQEDTGLTTALTSELSGILAWAVEGLRTLRHRGRFVQPHSSQEVLEECRRMVSPIHGFIEDQLLVGPEFRVATRDVWRAWIIWCESHGVRNNRDQSSFGRDLRAALPGLTATQHQFAGQRTRYYIGIGLQIVGGL